MATLHIRYAGNIVSLPEGANFSPGNYGTARLKYRVNSTSVGELGLTTHTDAKEYCGLQMRIGNQICYIGRVSTTSYISGDTVDYHDSSMGDRYISASSASEYATSTESRSIDYYSSSMSTSTSQYTQVTSTQQIQTNSYTQQVWTNSYTYQVETRSYTNEVLTKTENYSYNIGNGNATSSKNPGMLTWGQSGVYTTTETVITRTASGQVLTNSSFRETYYDSVKRSESTTNSWGFRWSPAENPGQTRVLESRTTRKTENLKYSYTFWNSHNGSASTDPVETSSQTAGVTAYTWTYEKVRTYGAVSSSVTNGASTVSDASGATYTASKTDNWYITTSHKKNSIRVSSTYTTSKTVYTTAMTASSISRYRRQNLNSTTYGSYSSRWTYYWSSCAYYVRSYYSTATYREYDTRTSNEYSTRTVREYSTRSYTGSTYYSSITRSTSTVSETIHNMNL